MMEYEGYVAVFEFDPTIDAFHGEVANTVDTITFEGRSVDELRAAFQDSVDDYLELCEREGRRPDHPYSGTFSLRLGPKLHRAAAVAASARGVSLNRFATDAIRERLARLGISETDLDEAAEWARAGDRATG
jgi:predicted HicB family RNase H-like nuclease